MKTWLRGFCIALVGLFATLALAEESGTVTFQWEPPTERVDGTPLDPATEIGFYELRCWDVETPGEYTTLEIPGQSEGGSYTSAMADLFPDYGHYECELSAVDNYGVYSDFVLAQGETPLPYLPPKPGSPTNVLILFQ